MVVTSYTSYYQSILKVVTKKLGGNIGAISRAITSTIQKAVSKVSKGNAPTSISTPQAETGTGYNPATRTNVGIVGETRTGKVSPSTSAGIGTGTITTTKPSGSSGSTSTDSKNVEVLYGGGVRSGKVTSYGNAIVEGTGMSANQISRIAFEEAQKKFGDNVRVGGFSATIPSEYFNQPSYTSQSVSASSVPVKPSQVQASNVSNKITLSSLGSDYLYGEKSQRFAGVGLVGLGIPPGFITFKEIKTGLQESKYFPARVLSYGVPTTPLGTAITFSLPSALGSVPKVARIGASGIIAGLGTKTALDKSLSTEERVFGGVIGTLGAVGTYAEVSPYINLGKVTNPVKTIEVGGKNIEVIPSVKNIVSGKEYDIALIPAGDIATGSTSAFKSTAYGFSPQVQATYLGKTGTITTSAKSLIPQGIGKVTRTFKDYSLTKNEVTPTRKVFATPWDIETGLAQTRVSRLGEELFSFPKDSQISFKIGGKPQIVTFPEAKVGTPKETGVWLAKQFTPKPTTTELEVTTMANIYGQKVGITKIGGLKVNLYSAKLIGKGESTTGLKNINNILSSSSSTDTSGYSAISFSQIAKLIKPSVSKEVSVSSQIVSTSFVDYYPSPTYPSPTYPSPTYPSPTYPSPYKTPIAPNYPSIDFPRFSFSEGVSKRTLRGKQRYKYTPSYEALVFNIKGKAPRGVETGARLRPIPKGYSFAFKSSPVKFNVGTSFKAPSFSSSFKVPKMNTNFKIPKLKKMRRIKI